jgi:hypothetical protein
MRTNQLALVIDTPEADFRLDERTREIGRTGIAQAREALRAAAARAEAQQAARAAA